MSVTLPSLNEFRKKIGNGSLLFFALATTTTTFAGRLHTEEEHTRKIREFLNFAAGCLFALGLLIALLRIVSVFFAHRPARGMIDGLAAGLIAGVVGGYFGYGFHDIYHVAGYLDERYFEPSYYRIALCVLFAVPVGGIMGLLCDLAHPDRAIPWRKYLGALILSIGILLCVTGMGVALYTPDMKGAGIIVSDIQLLFEIFLLAFALIVTTSFGWPFRRISARLPVLFMSIVVGRLLTLLLPGFDSQLARAGVRLYRSQFLYEQDVSTSTSIFGLWTTGQTQLASTVVAFVIWVVLCYCIFYRNHRLNAWLDSHFGVANA